MKTAFLNRKYDKTILTLAIPALGALAADPLISLIDTVFVGQLGAIPLGALGINTSVFSFSFFLFNFLAYGTTPLIAKAVARGDHKSAGATVIQSFTLAILLGFSSLFLLELFARPVLIIMGAEGNLLEASLTYLRIRALAGPAVLIITAGHGIFRGFQDTRTPFIVTAGLNVINLVLDPLFIFIFEWGLAGAAWATVIAQWSGALWFLWLILKSNHKKITGPLFIPKISTLKPFVKIGGALSLRTFALIGTLTLATAIATRIGTVAVAAHQVAAQLWLFLALVVDALAIAAQALMAKYIGASDHFTARAIANRILVMGLAIGLILGVAFELLDEPLSRLFTDDPLVIEKVLIIFPFVAAMQPVNALVFVWDGIFIGQEKYRFLAMAMILSAIGGIAILLLVEPMSWGLKGVWWGIVALMGVRLLTLGGKYFNNREF